MNARQKTRLSEAVAAELRAEIGRRPWKDADLVQRSGVARATYFDIKAGRLVPTLTQLEAIVRAMGYERLSEFLVLAERDMPSVEFDEGRDL